MVAAIRRPPLADLVDGAAADRPPIGVVDVGDGVAKRAGAESRRQLVLNERDGVATEVGAHRCQPEEVRAAGRRRRDLTDRAGFEERHVLARRDLGGDCGDGAAVTTEHGSDALAAQLGQRRGDGLGPLGVDRHQAHLLAPNTSMAVGPLDRQPYALLFLTAAGTLRSARGVEGAEAELRRLLRRAGDGDGEQAEDRHDQNCWTSHVR